MNKYEAVRHCRELLRTFFLQFPCKFRKVKNTIKVTHEFCPQYPVFIHLDKVSAEELETMKHHAAELLAMRFTEEVAGCANMMDRWLNRDKTTGPSILKSTTVAGFEKDLCA